MIRRTILSDKSRFQVATNEIAQLVKSGLEDQDIIDQLKHKYQESETAKILLWLKQGVDHEHINYYTKPLKAIFWLILLIKAYQIPSVLLVTDFPLWGLIGLLLIGPSLVIIGLMLSNRPSKSNYYLIMMFCLWSLNRIEWKMDSGDSLANLIFVVSILLAIAGGGLAFYLSRTVDDGPLRVEKALKLGDSKVASINSLTKT